MKELVSVLTSNYPTKVLYFSYKNLLLQCF